MANETVNSLVKHLLEHNIKLIDYRNFLALSHGGIVQICPETNMPCNASCIFFNLFKVNSKLRVVISCKTIRQQYIVEITENNEKN